MLKVACPMGDVDADDVPLGFIADLQIAACAADVARDVIVDNEAPGLKGEKCAR